MSRNNHPAVLERYFTVDQEHALLSTVKQYGDILARRDYAWIRAMLYSGLRLKEFSLITVGDVADALRFGSLFIPKEHRKGFNAKMQLGGETRVVNRADDHRVRLHEALRRALRDLLVIRQEMRLPEDLDAPLVASVRGHLMSTREFQVRFKKWVIEAGLPENASPHWLRHTGCMRVARSTACANPLLAVQRFAGHRSLSSTGVYVSVTKEEMDATLEAAFAVRRRSPSMAQRRAMFEGVNHG